MISLRRSVTFLLATKDNKVLSVSRKNNVKDWNLPGGKVEDNESPETAIVREVYEETGLVIVNPVPVFSSKENNFFCTTYIADVVAGELRDKANEGLVRMKNIRDLEQGSFWDYNYNLFKQLGMVY